MINLIVGISCVVCGIFALVVALGAGPLWLLALAALDFGAAWLNLWIYNSLKI